MIFYVYVAVISIMEILEIRRISDILKQCIGLMCTCKKYCKQCI